MTKKCSRSKKAMKPLSAIRTRRAFCSRSFPDCIKRGSQCKVRSMQRSLRGYTTKSPWKMTKEQLCREMAAFYLYKGKQAGRVAKGYRGTRRRRFSRYKK